MDESWLTEQFYDVSHEDDLAGFQSSLIARDDAAEPQSMLDDILSNTSPGTAIDDDLTSLQSILLAGDDVAEPQSILDDILSNANHPDTAIDDELADFQSSLIARDDQAEIKDPLREIRRAASKVSPVRVRTGPSLNPLR